MFGHLKAEDFIGLIEGGEDALENSRHRSHLQSCAQCSEAFVSAQEFHAELAKAAVDEQNIPEPDWFQFRADVRNAMLSRAARRQSRTSSWSAWYLKPAMTWGLAVAFAAGLSAGLMIWNRTAAVLVHQTPTIESPASNEAGQVASLETNDSALIPEDVSLESSALDAGLSPWSQTSIFEEVSQLSDAQSEKLLQLLEAENHRTTVQP